MSLVTASPKGSHVSFSVAWMIHKGSWDRHSLQYDYCRSTFSNFIHLIDVFLIYFYHLGANITKHGCNNNN